MELQQKYELSRRVTHRAYLDNTLESTLERLSSVLHKKKSDVIREAISFYAKNAERKQKSRILNAIKKTKHIDKNEFKDFEGTLTDGI